jgi:hypothetical protein
MAEAPTVRIVTAMLLGILVSLLKIDFVLLFNTFLLLLTLLLLLILCCHACNSVNGTSIIDGTCVGAECVQKTEATELCPLDKCGQVGTHLVRSCTGADNPVIELNPNYCLHDLRTNSWHLLVSKKQHNAKELAASCKQ